MRITKRRMLGVLGSFLLLSLCFVLAIINLNRSGEGSLIGYTVASGQPRTDGFYLKNVSSVDDPIYVENKDSNIVIPEFYNGVQIICIEEYAFEDCTFDNLIVEYSQDPIEIENYAFASVKGKNIIINRPITYTNGDSAKNIFQKSEIISVALPNSLGGIFRLFSWKNKML